MIRVDVCRAPPRGSTRAHNLIRSSQETLGPIDYPRVTEPTFRFRDHTDEDVKDGAEWVKKLKSVRKAESQYGKR